MSHRITFEEISQNNSSTAKGNDRKIKISRIFIFKSNKTDGLHEMIKIFLKLIQNIYDSQYFALFIKFNEIT